MKHLLPLLTALAAASSALAQFDMSALGKMQSEPFMEMQRPDIRKELKLSKQQSSEIDKIEKDVSSSMNTKGQSLTAPFQKMREADEQILALLDDGQKKRVFEIGIQIQGPPAMAYPEVSGPLGLSDDQVKQIAQLQSTFSSQAMDIATHNPGRGTEGKLEKLRDARDADMLKLLTGLQRDKFKEMQGPVFKNARPKGSIF